MKPESGNTISYWIDSADVPAFGPLDKDVSTDVCIVGAGIAGLTTAYFLAKAGKQVVVIDDGPICGGETQRTTAHLSNVFDDRYFVVQSEHGEDIAELIFESQSAAIDQIESIAQQEGIDCDFVRLDGYLFVGDQKKSKQEKDLEKEFKACKEVGFEDMEMKETLPLSFFPEPRACIRFGNQGQFHVLKYLAGMVKAVLRLGVQIYSGTHMATLSDGDIVKVKTSDKKTISARFVVVATNSPVSDWVRVHTKQSPYRTYVIAGKVPKGAVPTALYWDMDDPYHYIRLQKIDGDDENELLIIGGEDHRTGEEKHPESCFEALEEWARKFFPVMKSIDYRWSGQVMEPCDGIAFIGRDPAHDENVFIATGDSGQGMTHGTIAGVLLSDLILGNPNPWEKAYKPSRIPLKAAGEYVHENVNSVAQYGRYFQPAEVDSVNEIAPGEGALMRDHGKIVAAYKGMDGTITQCSAICPHLKGVVQWNSVEKSWDCPSHGSRFKATGEVINGPANCGLHDLENDDAELPPIPPGDSGIQPPPPPVM